MSEGETVDSRRGCLKQLEKHIKAIQSLANVNVTGQGQDQNEEQQASQTCHDKKCEHVNSLLAIGGHIEIIRKLIGEGENNLRKIHHDVPGRRKKAHGKPVAWIQSYIKYRNQRSRAAGYNLIHKVHKDVPGPGPREKALGNSLVARTIMDHLAVTDLMRFRRVCKTWKEEATIQLLSLRREAQVRKKYKVLFVSDEEDGEFRHKVGCLQEFTERYFDGPRKKFPLSEFHFRGVEGNPQKGGVPEDLSNFFSNYGHQIKVLHLEIGNSSVSTCKLVRKIIFEWATCLQSLTFEFPTKIDAKQAFDEALENVLASENKPERDSLSIEALKEIRFGKFVDFTPSLRFFRLVHKILSSASNLTKIADAHAEFTPVIVSAGKITALKTAELSFEMQMQSIAGFAEARPQLTDLEIRLAIRPSIEFLQSLQLILQSSAQTLKTLRVDGRLPNNYFTMDVPILENLEELHISSWVDDSEYKRGRILPPGFSLHASFPRLKTLYILDLEENNEDNMGQIYAARDNPFIVDDNSSSTVTTLGIAPQLKCSFNRKWLDQAAVLYPNVRILHLTIRKSVTEVPVICSTIWRLWSGSLEELHIEVRCYDKDEHLVLKMDQALTGFDKETCKRLRRQGDFTNGIIQGQEKTLKRGSSILDMTRLKVFSLRGWSSFIKCSHVSITHAFEPMRKRQGLRFEGFSSELEEYDSADDDSQLPLA